MLKPFSIALGVLGFVCLSCFMGCARSESKADAPSNVSGTPPANSTQSTGAAGSSGAASGAVKEETQNREAQNDEVKDELHTPPKGSAERQAIMDALRYDPKVVFVVNSLMVHNGWAWADVSPVENGRTAEGGPALLHMQNGRWKAVDLSRIPEDPDDPLEATSVTPAYIKKVRKAYPQAPADIFPKAQ